MKQMSRLLAPAALLGVLVALFGVVLSQSVSADSKKPQLTVDETSIQVMPESDNAKIKADKDKFAEDQIIVKYKKDKDGKPFKVVKVEKGKVKEKINEYSKRDDVEYSEPDYLAYAQMVPNDPLYPMQWNFYNPVKGSINIQSAWDMTMGSDTVTVAVVDTGIAYENYGSFCQAPDLALTKFASGWNFVNNTAHANDDNYHGTHVAGTIAQSTNNLRGAAGIAPGVKLMPVKVLGSDGVGLTSNVALGIRYAADHGANIINVSVASTAASTVLRDAAKYAFDKGVTVVAGCGNSNLSTGCAYPAAYTDYVISVGATQYDEKRAPYSNYGSTLTVMAPGGNTSVNQNGDAYVDGIVQQTYSSRGNTCSFAYALLQGTSMATPHVSGIAALLISKGNAVSPRQIKAAITETAKDLGTAGRDNVYGWGLANTYKALNWVGTPKVSITRPYNNQIFKSIGLIQINAKATDSEGITKVEFYDNGKLIGTETYPVQSVYSYFWVIDSANNGTHTLTAKAYNVRGLSTVSAPIKVIINIPPII